MSRIVNRLSKRSAAAIAQARRPGFYPDGQGLYLQVTDRGGVSWVLMYRKKPLRRKMGLGPYRLVSLDDARKKRDEAHRLLLEGQDPLAQRVARKAKERASRTFLDVARDYITAIKGKWENPRSLAQWSMTLLGESPNGEKTEHNYCRAIHNLPVGVIDTDAVLKVLEPIWNSKPETASRLRGRIESVIGFAMVKGWREEGLNPARWTKHLENALLSGDVREVKHFAALDYAELPSFYAKLKTREGLAARCLELAIFTAVRTNDLLSMRRDHVDLVGKVWTIPKTKTGKEHKVALSDAACDLLKRVMESHDEEVIFPGDRRGEAMSLGAMRRCRDRMIEDGLIAKKCDDSSWDARGLQIMGWRLHFIRARRDRSMFESRH